MPYKKMNPRHDLVVTRGDEIEENEVYLLLAARFRAVKYILALSLIVFVIAMISIFSKDITLENFKYLIRYVNTSSVEYSGDYRSIWYESTGSAKLELFNGDLAVVKPESFDLYDVSGSNTQSYSLNYNEPIDVIQGKYMIVYDLGGYSYNIFNNFSQLSGETLEYPISGAAVSDSGMFAVISGDLQYQSRIALYDHKAALITNIYKDKYIMDMKINSAGTQFIIASVYSSLGEYVSEIMIGEPYNDKPLNLLTLQGEMAITCGYHENGGYTVLTDKRLLTFDSSGTLSNEYPLGNIVPTRCIITNNYTVLTYNRNIVGESSCMKVFDTAGEPMISADGCTIEYKILDMKCREDNIYVLTDGAVLVYSVTGTGERTEAPIDRGSSSLFIYDNDNIFVGYSGEIRVFSLEKLINNEQ